MKIRFVSDLHLEINTNYRLTKKLLTPIKSDPRSKREVLVVAGDTIPSAFIKKKRNDADARSLKHAFGSMLELVYDHYEQIIFLGGNHDSYHSDILELKENFESFFYDQLGLSRAKVKFLEDEAVMLSPNAVLLCCTLWTDMFKDNPIVHESVGYGMNDFRLISYGPDRGFTTRDAYNIHKRSLNNLAELYKYHTMNFEENRPDGSTQVIVATHHAPSSKSASRHGDPTIDYGYFSELSEWVLDRPQISHWIHGHTHQIEDYLIGNTRVVSNPRGYGPGWVRDKCFEAFGIQKWIEIPEPSSKVGPDADLSSPSGQAQEG